MSQTKEAMLETPQSRKISRGASRQVARASTNNRKAAQAHHLKIGYTPPPRFHLEPQRTPDGFVRSGGRMPLKPQAIQPVDLPVPPRPKRKRR